MFLQSGQTCFAAQSDSRIPATQICLTFEVWIFSSLTTHGEGSGDRGCCYIWKHEVLGRGERTQVLFQFAKVQWAETTAENDLEMKTDLRGHNDHSLNKAFTLTHLEGLSASPNPSVEFEIKTLLS